MRYQVMDYLNTYLECKSIVRSSTNSPIISLVHRSPFSVPREYPLQMNEYTNIRLWTKERQLLAKLHLKLDLKERSILYMEKKNLQSEYKRQVCSCNFRWYMHKFRWWYIHNLIALNNEDCNNHLVNPVPDQNSLGFNKSCPGSRPI